MRSEKNFSQVREAAEHQRRDPLLDGHLDSIFDRAHRLEFSEREFLDRFFGELVERFGWVASR